MPVEDRQTTTADCCNEVCILQVCDKLLCDRLKSEMHGTRLHDDIAWLHMLAGTFDFLHEFELVTHLLYSPDLTSIHLFLFLNILTWQGVSQRKNSVWRISWIIWGMSKKRTYRSIFKNRLKESTNVLMLRVITLKSIKINFKNCPSFLSTKNFQNFQIIHRKLSTAYKDCCGIFSLIKCNSVLDEIIYNLLVKT